MTRKISGVVVATVTPFQSEEVDKQGIAELTDFLSSKGVGALFECGTTGEGFIMTKEQRKRASELTVERSPIPVVIHTGTNNFEDTREFNLHARDIGADAVAVITPMYYPFATDGLVDYFLRVARSCELPMYIYSNPMRSGLKMSPESIAKIFGDGPPNVAGVKESSGDMTYFGKLIQHLPGKSVFNGADACFLPALTLGAFGQVSGYANATPEFHVELYNAWKLGDLEAAMRVQTRISRLKSLLEVPYIQPLKEALKLRGVRAGDVRPPLTKMSQREIEQLAKNLSELAPELFLPKKRVTAV